MALSESAILSMPVWNLCTFFLDFVLRSWGKSAEIGCMIKLAKHVLLCVRNYVSCAVFH